jgi:hypothetical protein
MASEEKAPCPLCNGRQWIITSEEKEKPCKCLRKKMLEDHLGPEITTARLIQSKLFIPGGDDRTQDNLFIKGTWTTVLSHLRWALGCKFNTKPDKPHRFCIETDAKVISVFVGAHSYMHRSKDTREDVDTYNSLEDLVEPHDLFILRLGFLGYANKAAAGSIKQALGVREVACKPTWIIETPNSIFGPGHFSYSNDLADYIEERFDVVDLRSKDDSPDEAQGFAVPVIPSSPESDPDADEVSMGGPSAPVDPQKYMPEERIRVDSGANEFELGGEKKKDRWKKKKGSNGEFGGDM